MIALPKLPPQDELEALIKEARARQLRRRLLAAASVAIAAAFGLGVYAIAIHGNGTSASAGDSVSPPLCRGSQLRGLTVLQAATMSGVGLATITNASTASCSLPSGTPQVRITWRGTTLAIRERPSRGRAGPPAHILQPGARAAIPLAWTNWCGRPQRLARLVFDVRFRGGLEVRAPQRLTGHPACVDASAGSVLSVGRLSRG